MRKSLWVAFFWMGLALVGIPLAWALVDKNRIKEVPPWEYHPPAGEVARALLPPEIMEGTKLKYEMMQYEIY